MSGRGRGYGGFRGTERGVGRGGGRGGGGPAWNTRSRVPPLAIPATKVYVGGLPQDFECQQLYDLFSTIGHVVECTLLKGYGFVVRYLLVCEGNPLPLRVHLASPHLLCLCLRSIALQLAGGGPARDAAAEQLPDRAGLLDCGQGAQATELVVHV